MSSAAPSPTSSRVRSARVSAVESDTREAIVLAALNLFAKHGIDGVSLRQIVTAAGQSNPSAVHYHFRSKEGLVEAVLDYVSAQLVPIENRSLQSMSDAREQGRLTVREVIRLFFTPMILVYSASPAGRMSVRFLARLIWQVEDVGSINRVLNSYASLHGQVVGMLHELLPHQPREKVNFLLMAAITNLLHGLADLNVLDRYASLGMRQLYQERPQDFAEWFVDYVAAGLEGGPLPQSGDQSPGAYAQSKAA
jgi:AcrR family transcriptional regulator